MEYENDIRQTTDGFSIIKTMNTDDTAVAVAALHAEIDRTVNDTA